MMRHEVERRLRRAPKSAQRDAAFRKAIRSIPKGRVATYGQVAAAAGYPLYHRHVAQFLQRSAGALPWQRVVGAGGDEEGVEELGVSIERFVACDEVDLDGVFAGVGGGGREDDVAVEEVEGDRLAADFDGQDEGALLFEIEDDLARGSEVEADGLRGVDGFGLGFGDVEGEVVAEASDVAR